MFFLRLYRSARMLAGMKAKSITTGATESTNPICKGLAHKLLIYKG
jgi:hypothetical protein